MGAFLALASIIVFGVGFVGLFRPRLVRLPDRYFAGSVLLFAFVVVAAGVTIDPAPNAEPTDGFFVSMLVVWLFVSAVLWFVRRTAAASRSPERSKQNVHAWFRQQTEAPAPVPETPTVEDEIAAIRRMASVQRPVPAPPQTVRRNAALVSSVYDLGDGETGDAASFSYRDVEGRHSERLVRDWWCEGIYIRGTCALRGELRNFRKDRITNWTLHE